MMKTQAHHNPWAGVTGIQGRVGEGAEMQCLWGAGRVTRINCYRNAQASLLAEN